VNPQEIYLDLTLTEKDTNLERLDGLTVRLMHDLRDQGAESVERPQDAGRPPGVKGDPFTVGALLLVAIPAFLPKLVEFLQAWSMRGAGRAVKIKTPAGLEVEFTPEKTLSEDDLLALVDKLKQAGA
jgi:hypothetical protein